MTLMRGAATAALVLEAGDDCLRRQDKILLNHGDLQPAPMFPRRLFHVRSEAGTASKTARQNRFGRSGRVDCGFKLDIIFEDYMEFGAAPGGNPQLRPMPVRQPSAHACGEESAGRDRPAA